VVNVDTVDNPDAPLLVDPNRAPQETEKALATGPHQQTRRGIQSSRIVDVLCCCVTILGGRARCGG
jgi:hypothetical protein